VVFLLLISVSGAFLVSDPELLSQKKASLINPESAKMLEKAKKAAPEQVEKNEFAIETPNAKEEVKAELKEATSSSNEHEKTDLKEILNQVDKGQFVYVIDHEAVFQYVDLEFERLTNLKEAQLNDKNLFSLVHSDDLPELMLAVIATMQKQKTQSNVGPYRIKSASSEEYISLISSIVPIFDESGSAHQVAIISKRIED
jgi:PAS domain-containing protein